MRHERKIVIGTLALGCILGLVLWVTESGAEPAPMGTGNTEAIAQREPVTGAKHEAPGPPGITTDPFDPDVEPAPKLTPLTFVTGLVRDVDGALAVGARVGLGRSIMKEGEESVAEWTEVWADTAGRYRFRATPGWKVRLWADSSSSIVTLLPPFEVQTGMEQIEDIQLWEGATVSGWVRDQAGHSIENATLEIETFFPDGTAPPELDPILLLPASLGPLVERHTATDEMGSYSLANLHPSCWVRISAHHQDLVPRQTTLEVPAGAGGVNFVLDPPAPIGTTDSGSARPTRTMIRGHVTGVDTADLRGIRVQIRGRSRSLTLGPVDATGAFQLSLDPGFKGAIRAICLNGRYSPSDYHEIHLGREEVLRSIQLVLRKP